MSGSGDAPDASHLDSVRQNVLADTAIENFPLEKKVRVAGYDFENDLTSEGQVDYKLMLESYLTTGFQSTNFGLAVKEINNMLDKKFSAEVPQPPADEVFEFAGFTRPKSKCTVFFSFTSNLISSGVRDTIRFLAKNNMVDCIVTTAGGVEEDLIKCLGETYLGDFKLPGKSLRKSGLNRIGNWRGGRVPCVFFIIIIISCGYFFVCFASFAFGWTSCVFSFSSYFRRGTNRCLHYCHQGSSLAASGCKLLYHDNILASCCCTCTC